MKFLKSYEEDKYFLRTTRGEKYLSSILYKPKDIKIGDYILVTFDNEKDEVVKVLATPETLKDSDEFRFLALTLNYRGGITGYFYNREIIKKLSKDEVEFYSNIKKYNL